MISSTGSKIASWQKKENQATLINTMNVMGQLDAVGGTAYLAGLDGDLPAIGGFRSYMGIVQERSHRRQLLEAANQTIHDGRNHGLETRTRDS